jgi:hypothetical protein
MTLSRNLSEDRQPSNEFKRRALEAAAKQADGYHAGITLDLYEWLEGADQGVKKLGLKSVQKLESESKGAVRVM